MLIGRIHVHANQLVCLEVLYSERIKILDRNNRVWKLQYCIEEANEADFITRFAENLGVEPGCESLLRTMLADDSGIENCDGWHQSLPRRPVHRGGSQH